MIGAQPSGFEAWWSQFLNIAYPVLQMLFWIVMIAVAVYAVVLFKRWVEAQTGGEKAASSEERISVEEFVE
jgi:cobalamin synthase